MDVPGSSRRRCREPTPSSRRNARPRCSVTDLVQSRRRRREEADAAILAARAAAAPRCCEPAPTPTLSAFVPPASDRNVRQRVSASQNRWSAPPVPVLALGSGAPTPRRCTVLSELRS